MSVLRQAPMGNALRSVASAGTICEVSVPMLWLDSTCTAAPAGWPVHQISPA